MKTRWTNRAGEWSIEVGRLDDGRWCATARDALLPCQVAAVLDRVIPWADWAEVEIHFTSTGYYDSGRRWGRPEDCYPPEGDDERELDYGRLVVCGRRAIALDKQQARVIWDAFEDEIRQVEIDREPDEPAWW